jgi:hypothetical protein
MLDAPNAAAALTCARTAFMTNQKLHLRLWYIPKAACKAAKAAVIIAQTTLSSTWEMLRKKPIAAAIAHVADDKEDYRYDYQGFRGMLQEKLDYVR